MNGITDDQLAAAAHRLRLSAGDLGTAFDAAAAEKDPGGLPFMVEHALAPPEMEPVQAALEAARRRGFVPEFIVRAAALGGMSAPAAYPVPGGAGAVQLQAIVNPTLGFLDVTLANRALTLAMERICHIVVQTEGGDVRGTGFLVGPQAVITSYHVIASLIKNGRPRSDSRDRIGVEFDRLTAGASGMVVPVAPEWFIGGSAPHPSEQPGQSALTFTGDGDPDYDTCLDFALIRLARAVGRQRGHYDLDPERWPKSGARGQVTLLQRPNTGLKMANGVVAALWPDRIRSRLKHTANSTAGSSGGLLLDADFEPIGLHQCGVSCGVELVNGAIPTARIARASPSFASVVGPDPLWCLEDGRPVIGRQGFQDAVLRAASGRTRIISVDGASGSGRTFSFRMLKSLLDDGSNLFVELPASDVPEGARALADLLLDRLNPSSVSAGRVLPDPSEAETAEEAWIRDVLFPAVAQAFSEAAPNRTIWLMIDDLDRCPLVNTSARHFLERLYAEIGQLPFLRVMLVGLGGPVPAADQKLVEYDGIRDPTDQDIEDYLRMTLVATGRSSRLAEVPGIRSAIRRMTRAAGMLGIAGLAELVSASIREEAA